MREKKKGGERGLRRRPLLFAEPLGREEGKKGEGGQKPRATRLERWKREEREHPIRFSFSLHRAEGGKRRGTAPGPVPSQRMRGKGKREGFVGSRSRSALSLQGGGGKKGGRWKVGQFPPSMPGGERRGGTASRIISLPES